LFKQKRNIFSSGQFKNEQNIVRLKHSNIKQQPTTHSYQQETHMNHIQLQLFKNILNQNITTKEKISNNNNSPLHVDEFAPEYLNKLIRETPKTKQSTNSIKTTWTNLRL